MPGAARRSEGLYAKAVDANPRSYAAQIARANHAINQSAVNHDVVERHARDCEIVKPDPSKDARQTEIE
ncbi:MAG: hypothetical protein ACREUU_18185 [Gammaproteobacteria bacterium]